MNGFAFPLIIGSKKHLRITEGAANKLRCAPFSALPLSYSLPLGTLGGFEPADLRFTRAITHVPSVCCPCYKRMAEMAVGIVGTYPNGLNLHERASVQHPCIFYRTHRPVRQTGFEPVIFCLASRRSTRLSYYRMKRRTSERDSHGNGIKPLGYNEDVSR